MHKRWNILNAPEEAVQELQRQLKISPVACKILVQRGIDSFEKAKDFFRPQLHQLHNPWLMKDMRLAVDRIFSAFEKKEKILVFGDYDVDGTTSVACMYQFLQKIYNPDLQLQLPEDDYYCYLDLVATAIAADIVPMTGENRILAFYGLQRVNENPCNGIKALMTLSGIQKTTLQITNLVFVIAPRVNAAGRMDDARKAVLLFVEKDYQKALEYAEMLHSDNTDRKEADGNITGEALALIDADEVLVNRKSTVLYQPHWHKGVVGIVASRLIEKYYRPTVVLTKSGDVVAGSARSVPGFNLYEAIYACREHLLGYGGHFAAAGMTLLPEQVAPFSQKFEEVITATITDELLTPEIIIDAEIRFNAINQTLYNIITQMEPFGPDNLRPVFVVRSVMDNGWSKIVKEEHVKFSLQQDNIFFSGIGFGMADKFELLQLKQPLDVVFTLDENEWNGNKSLQLKVIDCRLSA
ncbi:putative single-stranded-DNA-specific exonuclease RecJ, partial [Ostertagia ostertagi]